MWSCHGAPFADRSSVGYARPVTFDPFGSASRFVPARLLHRLIRVAGVCLCLAFLALRVRQYPRFAFKPLWAVETLVFAVLAASFVLRADPVDRARGLREIAVPWVGGLLPFGLLLSSPHPWIAGNRVALLVVFWWMTLSTGFTVWGIWALRRSFSLTVEARVLVGRGPYRWVRHPIYLGEVLTAGAVALWRFSAANVGLLVAFTGVQLARARWEERKLERNFPEYVRFASRSWWLW